MPGDLVIKGLSGAAAFVGPAHRGPLAKPVLVKSLEDFERVFGGRRDLRFGRAKVPNHTWHAARAFFGQGGGELYVQRVARDDGRRPLACDYLGERDPGGEGPRRRWRGLRALARQPGVGIVAAPGSTHGIDASYQPEASAIARGLIEHARRCGDRFALLDGGLRQATDEVLGLRSELGDAVAAALYHPWIVPVSASGEEVVAVPASAVVAGAVIAAERDGGIGAETRPLEGVAGLAAELGTDDASALATGGVNAIRSFADGTCRIWSNRTLSSDPEWKYVNLARYLIYLEHSIDEGLERAVFEPNDEAAWVQVRRAVEDFLTVEWRSGRLQGARPDEAFFVRCDRTTMTQADIDAGRLICMVGVAPARPAEFTIFRIGRSILTDA